MTLTAVVNHLLEGAPWARGRLRTHAGQRIAVNSGAWRVGLKIDEKGFLVDISGTPTDALAPDLAIEISPAALARSLFRPGELRREAHISGNAGLAESVAFVWQHLEWDFEDDLSRITGDIAARRIVAAGKSLASSATEAGRRFADGLSEYLRHDAGLVVANAEISLFVREVDEFRDCVEKLDARLSRLEEGRS